MKNKLPEVQFCWMLKCWCKLALDCSVWGLKMLMPPSPLVSLPVSHASQLSGHVQPVNQLGSQSVGGESLQGNIRQM